jgi:hypothetical protein
MVYAFINWLLLLLTAWWGKIVFDVILSPTKRPIPSAAAPTSGEHDVVAADHTFPHDEQLGKGDDADVADVPGERMKPLRYVLMAGTTALLGFLVYVIAVLQDNASQRGIPLMIIGGLILNLVYLYFSHPAAARKQSRLARLVRLWLDAKERELRDRAEQSSNSD